ncbi:MAG: DNA repair protein RecO [Anaerolineae bacterium]|nr:DNA repair protein RecO [Anaerolineae bacterium]
MAQPKLYQVEGVVLARRDFGEADRVVTVLTPVERVDLLAHGVRKTRSRKSGHLELFCTTQLLISRAKSSWDVVSQAEATTTRAALREDFNRGTYARYVAELVLRFFEGETGEPLYRLVEATLSLLEAEPHLERVVRWYEQQLLALAGFRPELDYCVGERDSEACGAALHPRPQDSQPYGFSPERGGALCPDCSYALRAERGVLLLSPSALSWLQGFQRRHYSELGDYEFPSRTQREVARVMERYIIHHLERRPAVLRLMGDHEVSATGSHVGDG